MINFEAHQLNRNTFNLAFQIGKPRLLQQGVVLFFSLIALVAMSLAAVALIRSVDTNNMIAGNLGFKQSTMFSSDTGIAAAMAWIKANPTSLNDESPENAAYGYYPSYSPSTALKAFLDDDDNVSTSKLVELAADSQGNAIRYVIHRMCDAEGSPSAVHCLKGPLSDVKNDKGEKDPNFIDPQATIMYRVTARVVGPKNTVSYLQTFVY